jgi:PEP-CTERM motif
MNTRLSMWMAALCSLVLASSTAKADYLDLFLPSVPGPAGAPPSGIVFNPVGLGGAFAGTILGGTVGVTGTLAAGGGANINPTLVPQSGFGTIGFSTTDNTSPQHSYGGIYSPTTPLSDRIGYSSVYAGGPLFGPGTAVAIAFSSPIVDPVFHVASLDFSYLWFSVPANIGLGMSAPPVLLSGNGDGVDGLGLTLVPSPGVDSGGFIIHDLLPATSDPSFPPVDHNDTVPPLLVGSRSAYGSIQFFGSLTGISFEIRNGTLPLGGLSPGGIDNATFTISAVPEPSSMLLTGLAVLGLGWFRIRKHEASEVV